MMKENVTPCFYYNRRRQDQHQHQMRPQHQHPHQHQQQHQPAQQANASRPPHYVELHVNAGECVSLQLLDGQEQVLAGPATITMISQQQNPPVPIPVQVPPGHMIHQIADENGTLKHIILSVMDTDDGAPLDSTVITLPQGTFRIDSQGELVSTGNGAADSVPLTTLTQQAYFANYDGSPVAGYEAPAQPASVEEATTASAIPPTAAQYQPAGSAAEGTEPAESGEQQDDGNSSVAAQADTEKTTQSAKQQSTNGSQASEPTADPLPAPTNTEAPSADIKQLAAPAASIHSDTQAAYVAAQVMGPQMDQLMNGGPPPPMLSTVDGQIYSYQNCCCCCYCDPQEAAGQQLALGVSSQPDVMGVAMSDGSASQTANRIGSRGSSCNLSHSNGSVGYSPGAMMAPLQGHHAMRMPIMPTCPAAGTPMPPVVGQSSTQGGQQSAVAGPYANDKGHQSSAKASGRGGAGYKQQHKLGALGGRDGDRQQQQGYGGQYHGQGYNKAMSAGGGGHNQHHQSYHHHQPADLSQASAFKPQVLLPSQAGVMMGGNYSPAYQNYNHVPTTLAAVVSANSATSNQNQKQQSQANYRMPESDSYMQRSNNRDQVSYCHANNSYGAVSNPRQSQHHNTNENKRQSLISLDKNNSSNQHSSNNRYAAAAANVKVISNNHITSSSDQLGSAQPSAVSQSVSPIRAGARVKGPPQQHQQQHHNNHHNYNHHNQANGLRSNHHHHNHSFKDSSNSNNSNGTQMHETNKEPNNFHSGLSYVKSRNAYAQQDHHHQQQQQHNNHTNYSNAPITKHISNVIPNYYPPQTLGTQHKGVWQQGNKFNQLKSNAPEFVVPDVPAVEPQSIPSRPHNANNNTSASSADALVSRDQESGTSTVTTHDVAPIQAPDTSTKNEPKELGATSASSENIDSRSSRGKQKKCQNRSKSPIVKSNRSSGSPKQNSSPLGGSTNKTITATATSRSTAARNNDPIQQQFLETVQIDNIIIKASKANNTDDKDKDKDRSKDKEKDKDKGSIRIRSESKSTNRENNATGKQGKKQQHQQQQRVLANSNRDKSSSNSGKSSENPSSSASSSSKCEALSPDDKAHVAGLSSVTPVSRETADGRTASGESEQQAVAKSDVSEESGSSALSANDRSSVSTAAVRRAAESSGRLEAPEATELSARLESQLTKHNNKQQQQQGKQNNSSTNQATSTQGVSSPNKKSSSPSRNRSKKVSALPQPIKFSNLIRQSRTRFVAMLARLVQRSLSSCSDTKFAGLLLVLFTVFAMLLAIFIHLYIVAPVTE